jgi:beta-glucosidase
MEASVPVPIRQLQGFKRIYLEAGETTTVSFTLTPYQLALVDEAGRRLVEPGEFQISVGGRQPMAGDEAGEGSEVLLGTVTVVGEPTEVR